MSNTPVNAIKDQLIPLIEEQMKRHQLVVIWDGPNENSPMSAPRNICGSTVDRGPDLLKTSADA